MKRRDFLRTVLAATGVATLTPAHFAVTTTNPLDEIANIEFTAENLVKHRATFQAALDEIHRKLNS